MFRRFRDCCSLCPRRSLRHCRHAQADPGSIERTIPKFETRPIEKQARVAAPSFRRSRSTLRGHLRAERRQYRGRDGLLVRRAGAELRALSRKPSRPGRARQDRCGHYRTLSARGLCLVLRDLPQQSVQSGIVRIRVVEGFVDEVDLEGRRSAAKSAPSPRASAGPAAPRETLERVGLTRDIPGLLVSDVRISRAPQDPARHQLTIALGADRIRGLVYTDNHGTIDGARIRGYSSFTVSSLAFPGDQCSSTCSLSRPTISATSMAKRELASDRFGRPALLAFGVIW